MSHQGRILVVAEDAGLDDLAARVAAFGHEVCATESSATAALAAATAAQPELALVDLSIGGIGSAARTMSVDLGVSVVFLVDAPDDELLHEAQAADPLGYLSKPVAEAQLRLGIFSALATRRRLSKPRSLTRFPRQELLETIFQSVNEGVSVVDTKYQIRFCNPAAASMVGMETVETADPRLQNFHFLRPDKTTSMAWEELPQFRAIEFGEVSKNVEIYLMAPHATEGLFASMDAKPLYDDEGRRTGCLTVTRDITPVKKREVELRELAGRLAEQTQTLSTVFDGIADGIAVLDTAGKVVRINPGATEIITPELVDDLSRMPPGAGMDVFYPDRVTPFRFKDLPHVRALHGEPRHNVRLFVVHPSMPEGKMLSISAQAIHAASEEPSHIVVLFRDVTVEHQQEQALLHAFTQGRLDVIDTVLHNVGNAINSVATGVGTLCERIQSRKLLHRLSAVAAALRTHEDDWLDYLRNDPQGTQVLPFLTALDKDMQQENTELEGTLARVTERVQHIVEMLRTQQSFDVDSASRKIVSLRKAVWSSVHILEESLHSSGIAVQVDCKTAPNAVHIHESRFQQMLVNLVRNAIDAIKARADTNGADFRPAVHIDGYVKDDHLMVDVTDNGVGIDPALLDQVFAPGFTTKKGGNGLGLHSAANYVIDSGGRIEAISDGPGQGATIRSGWPLQTMLPE